MSISLYNYLCQNIVGSEDHVRLTRLMNASKDQYGSSKFSTQITSGSFGEGLELQGSDSDMMFVFRDIEVTDQKKLHAVHSAIYFFSVTDDVKPGYAYLRLIKGNTLRNVLLCRGFEGQLYLSSTAMKQCFMNEVLTVVHGPCVSDKEGIFDFAHCLHSKAWIFTASKWVSRSKNTWPTSEVKQRVIDHGVLFVPIGSGGNLNEELKWRISFSVGEKFLIYSFTHTQLLCYSLMKVLLTDVIRKSPGCKDLLCSYFIKTILFWLSEELPTSMWKKDDLIPCFMKCVKRLVFCVEYSICPHYFIPENNLFENKIIGQGRTKLLETLYILMNYGWQCIFISPQISTVSVSCREQFNDDFFFNDIKKILNSKLLSTVRYKEPMDYVKNLQVVFSYRTKKLRSISLSNMSQNCISIAHTIHLSSLLSNKSKSKQYKQCLYYILQSTNHDAVTGWLMLASLFYEKKQYNKTLYVLTYSLRKCTREKLYYGANVSEVHRELFCSRTLRKLGIIRMLRLISISFVVFHPESSLIPGEIKLDVLNVPYVLPPVVYLHFLTFLCHYHLHNVRNLQKSLGDLCITIKTNYFISDFSTKAAAYDCLGVAFQIIGDLESAREIFVRSINLYPDLLLNCSFKRLAMMNSL
ncbi:Hypothetical predicted protein [Mytilus galloprovincialis]|uniref:Mab-21-like HhH/H2TH-like domain-containing protein n=1 Tax=Mytilus galloprovincialis TaxID=29158 RepID=A0A8B6GN98_MYTGA|nr:Hypothetical predicted protein [Mytilus galloprovincialis]